MQPKQLLNQLFPLEWIRLKHRPVKNFTVWLHSFLLLLKKASKDITTSNAYLLCPVLHVATR